MEKEINFFREYRVEIKKREKKRFVIQVSSIVILSIYFVVVLVIISSLLYLKNQEKKLIGDTKNTESAIESLRPIETKQIYLAEKIKSLEQIFSERKEHQKIAKSFFALLPLGISVKGFSIDETGQIQFRLEAEKFSDLKQFFSNLYSSEEYVEIPVKSADVGAFSYREKTGYSLDMKIGFLKE